MKHIILASLSICWFALITVSNSVAAPVRPQWVYIQNTPLTSGGVQAAYGQELGYTSDNLGNAAVFVQLSDSKTNGIGGNILWISSKGALLAKIDVSVNELNSIAQSFFVSVSSTAVIIVDLSNDKDTNGKTYSLVKYTLSGKTLVRSPFGIDGSGVLTQGGIYPFNAQMGGSLTGVVLQSTLGTNNAFSYYHY